MARIAWVEDEQATGAVEEIYRRWKGKNPGRSMPDILKCFSARPDFLQQMIDVSYRLHFQDGHLNRRTKEMIATVVSAINHCPY